MFVNFADVCLTARMDVLMVFARDQDFVCAKLALSKIEALKAVKVVYHVFKMSCV